MQKETSQMSAEDAEVTYRFMLMCEQAQRRKIELLETFPNPSEIQQDITKILREKLNKAIAARKAHFPDKAMDFETAVELLESAQKNLVRDEMRDYAIEQIDIVASWLRNYDCCRSNYEL
jgi:hypothetical protein